MYKYEVFGSPEGYDAETGIARLARRAQKPQKADPRAILQSRLKALQDLRAEIDQYFNKLLAELDADYKGVSKVKDGVDVAATVLQIWTNQVKLVQTYYKSLKLSGAELAKLNNELAKTWMKDRVTDMGGVIGGTMNVTGDGALHGRSAKYS